MFHAKTLEWCYATSIHKMKIDIYSSCDKNLSFQVHAYLLKKRKLLENHILNMYLGKDTRAYVLIVKIVLHVT